MGIAKGTAGKKTRKREAGAALVEAALTMIGFFLLMMGVIETGRFLNVQQVVTNAAREGARLGIAPAVGTNNLPNSGEIQTRVSTFLASANITGATVTITPVSVATGGPQPTQFTRVTIQVPYSLVTQSSWFDAFKVTLTGQSMMRNETSP